MKGLLNLILGVGFPVSISRIHIGEGSSILGTWIFWWSYNLSHPYLMASQPTPPNVPPPRNKASLRAY